MNNSKVIWFTGLSGSGKTTIALALKSELEHLGKKVKILDGDEVRNTLHKHLGFTPEDIKENNRLITELCLDYLNSFDFILVPIISPFRESRVLARKALGSNFIELFIKCSIQACIERDVKGHYKKALNGEMKNFIGLSKENPYEEPENPEVTLETNKEKLSESIQKTLDYLRKNRFL